VTSRGPEFDRARLFAELAKALGVWGAHDPASLERELAVELRDARDADLAEFGARVRATNQGWGFHAHDPVARRVSRLMSRLVLRPGSKLEGAEQLEIATQKPVFLVANHLSYIDANTIDALIVNGGHQDVADRLTVLVGPKVFALPIRRMASLCFGAIKIPQSQSNASGEAVMPRREVARLAVQTLASVAECHARGDHVLIFPEGSRSRTRAMGRVLAASARYFETPGSMILPLGLWGTETLAPVDSDRISEAEVHCRVGRPIEAALLAERAGGRRPVVADALGYLIADLLPESYRGEYGAVPPDRVAARAAASSFARA